MKSSALLHRTRAVLGALACLWTFSAAQAGPLGYSLTGATHYTPGCGAGTATIGTCGGPDTGWLSIVNTGLSTFVGTASLTGIAPGQTINLTLSGALNPGEAWVFNAGPESSNQGGFNKVAGSDDLGLLFSISGTIDGAALVASIYDSEIHSGVFKTNPFGVTLDNYVLQGGDSQGRDTGDGFEEGQADGQFVWSAKAGTDVPEPGSIGLALAALAAMGAVRRRRRA